MGNSAWRRFLSLKTTAGLLALMLAFLVLNVALPQGRVVGEGALGPIADRSPITAFLFRTLGLGNIPTSPPFLVLLSLFFLQLTGVLWRFTSVTVRRVRFQPVRWEDWDRIPLGERGGEGALTRLTRAGFRIHALEGSARWGVRNRVSPLGFLFFHYSFLFFLAGGLLIHYTRWVGTVDLVRGSLYAFSPQTAKALRVPSLAPRDGFSILLERVVAQEERGEPVELQADLRFEAGPGSIVGRARINHPARFEGYAFLPQSTDSAMSFKVYDGRGFLVDTLAVMTQCRIGAPAAVPLPGGCTLAIRCAGGKMGEVRCGNRAVWFPLAEGGREAAGGIEVQFASETPWVSFLVIHERGPGFLIAGFILAVAGLLFRFVFPRQDVVVASGTLYFKGEYFPSVLREDLEPLQEETDDAP